MPCYFNIFNGTQMNSLRVSNIQGPQGILHQIPLPALPVLQRSSQRATGCWTPQKATSPSAPAPLRRNPGTRAGQAYSPCHFMNRSWTSTKNAVQKKAFFEVGHIFTWQGHQSAVRMCRILAWHSIPPGRRQCWCHPSPTCCWFRTPGGPFRRWPRHPSWGRGETGGAVKEDDTFILRAKQHEPWTEVIFGSKVLNNDVNTWKGNEDQNIDVNDRKWTYWISEDMYGSVNSLDDTWTKNIKE